MKSLCLIVFALLLVGCGQEQASYKAPRPTNAQKINNVESKIGTAQADSLREAGDRDAKMEEALQQIEMEGRK